MATVGLVRKDNGGLSITVDCEPGEVEGIIGSEAPATPLSGDVAQRLVSELQDVLTNLQTLVGSAAPAPAPETPPAA